MKITTSIRSNIFSSYIGHKCKDINDDDHVLILKGISYSGYEEDKIVAIIGYEENFRQQDEIYIDQCQLILNSLSDITDTDAIELCNILGVISPTNFIYHLLGNNKLYSVNAMDSIRCVQYLQLKGYDVPHHLLGGKTLIASGLAIDIKQFYKLSRII